MSTNHTTLDLVLDLQVTTDNSKLPTQDNFELWVRTALRNTMTEAELTIRIVDEAESQELNNTYREKNKPTNVLSFPFEAPPEIEFPLLGDLIICASVVEQEAIQQNKTLQEHWTHMVVHGCLHLLGYDHINDSEAEDMESIETQIIESLGFNNPYKAK